MARVRTFIGIDIGKAIRNRAVALQDKIAQSASGVKWVHADNLHVTLLFLGEVEERSLADICQVVSESAGSHASFPLSVERVGSFPNARRPRVLWVGVGQGAQEICSLHDSLEGPLLDLGCYRREERKYTPHITLGRVRSEVPLPGLSESLMKHSEWRGGETMVDHVSVMSSELGRDGPTYTVLSRAKLTQ